MAYDERVAQRIREELGGMPGLVEKKMFGGVGYMLRGNMAVGVLGSDLIVRLGAAQQTDALLQPHVRVFDMTGRPMKGWVLVSPEGYESENELRRWIDHGVAFALSLPPK